MGTRGISLASYSLKQERWVIAATVVMESAWLTAASGVIFTLGGAGSPFNWFAVIAVVIIGFVVSRLITVPVNSRSLTRSFSAAAASSAMGLAAAYLIVANQLDADLTLDLAWIRHVAEAAYQPNTESYLSRAFWGTLLSLMFWWRGFHLAASDQPVVTSLTSFRLGLIVIGTSVIVDVARSSQLSAVAVMLLFVISGLATLSIGRMTPGSVKLSRLRDWSTIIAPVVLAVVGIGLVFGLLLSALLPSFRQLLAAPVSFVGKTVVGPVIVFVVYLWSSIVTWLVSLADPGGQSSGPAQFAEGPGRSLADTIAADNSPPAFLEVLFWALFVIVVVTVLAAVLIATAYRLRRMAVRGRSGEAGQRQSTREGSDVWGDTRSLLHALLPRRSRESPQERLRLPDDEPSIMEPLRIYYQLLRVADDKSIPRPPSETPTEFQERLQAVFPSRLVDLATNAFVAACYGHRAPSESQISELRAQVSLDQELAKAVRQDRSRRLCRV